MIGGHGKVGLRLLRLLARNGHRGCGVIRKAEQASDLEAVGAEPVLCDLERGDDLRPHVGTADAIVFAAGAGPGSGPERKRTVDYGAAVTSMQAASDLGVARFVIVSSIGTHDVAGAAEAMRPYLQAKRDADDALKQSGLEWTIVKPGHLTDAPGSGRVQVSRTFGGRADVPRDDVALVLLECLHAPNTIGVEFELFEGDIPAREAVPLPLASTDELLARRQGFGPPTARSVVLQDSSLPVLLNPSRPCLYWSTARLPVGIGHPSPSVSCGMVAMWSQFRAIVARHVVWLPSPWFAPTGARPAFASRNGCQRPSRARRTTSPCHRNGAASPRRARILRPLPGGRIARRNGSGCPGWDWIGRRGGQSGLPIPPSCCGHLMAGSSQNARSRFRGPSTWAAWSARESPP